MDDRHDKIFSAFYPVRGPTRTHARATRVPPQVVIRGIGYESVRANCELKRMDRPGTAGTGIRQIIDK